jgi:hypothetical protein
MRDVLRLVRQILRDQEDGSDYDELYFGMQDVEILLADNLRAMRADMTERMRSVRGSGRKTKSASKKSTPRKQSKKQKLLTSMTAKKWKTYSKGSGRKTYVQIRSQVSRSKAYKSKAKKL